MAELFIPVLQGTTREQRKSIHASRYMAKLAEQFEDVKTEVVDPKDFNFPGDGNDPEGKDPRYSQLTAEADGFIIVTPEYNHSFPGSLKRMLDSELKNYIHKPVGFVGVSSGRFGGVRAIESLIPTVREMGMVPTFAETPIPNISEQFDDGGNPTQDWLEGALKKTWMEVIWMAKAMKWARENLKSEYHE